MNNLQDMFGDFNDIFGKNKYPSWVDQDKVYKKVEKFPHGQLITESYEDKDGNYWSSSYWTYGTVKIDKKELEKQLVKAVTIEDYILAVSIRDQIKQLK